MTIDDAITIFHGLECNPLFSEKHFKAFDMAIESLYMWGEVREEIVHLHDWAFDREEILRIIDKHLQEVTDGD